MEAEPVRAESPDAFLIAVIAASFLPIGLVIVAVHGGGALTVGIAFVAELLLTAALVLGIQRAIDRPAVGRPAPDRTRGAD